MVAFPVSSCRLSRSSRFMDNLQTEVLEIEFLSYSKGLPTISEEDFARILLRYTNVDDVSGYLENVRHSIPDEKVCCFPSLNSLYHRMVPLTAAILCLIVQGIAKSNTLHYHVIHQLTGLDIHTVFKAMFLGK